MNDTENNSEDDLHGPPVVNPSRATDHLFENEVGTSTQSKAQIGYVRNSVAKPIDLPFDPDHSKQPLMHQIFEERANHFSEHVALRQHSEFLTYSKLNERANKLAHYLRENFALGRKPDEIVAVYLEKSFDLFIAVLAIQKIGAAFVVFETTNTSKADDSVRLNVMLDDIKPNAIIQKSTLPCPQERAYQVLNIDHNDTAIQSMSPENVSLSNPSPFHLSYVAFTSGSTGKPKGAMIEHAGVYSRVVAHQRLMGIVTTDVIAQNCPYRTDAWIMEMWMALATGASLDLVPQNLSLKGFLDYARRFNTVPARSFFQQDINIAIFVPATLEEFQRLGLADSLADLLKVLISTGEKVTEDAQKVLDLFLAKKKCVINGYGPNEATIAATLFLYQEKGALFIGDTVPGLHAHVIDTKTAKEVLERPGELWLSGLGLARGYINTNDPGLNDRFFQHEKFGRTYRTGDLVCRDSEGRLVFKGRKDRQFKKYGNLIDPAEIEQVIEQFSFPGERRVLRSRVQLIEKKKLLVVELQLPPKVEPVSAISQLAAHLKATLSPFMLPARWVVYRPDTNADVAKYWKEEKREHPCAVFQLAAPLHVPRVVPPVTPLEEKLLKIWQELLLTDDEIKAGHLKIQVDHDFYLVGGDSLKYKMLETRFLSEFCNNSPTLRFPTEQFKRSPTIRFLANYIEVFSRETNIFRLDDQHDHAAEKEKAMPFVLIHALLGDARENYEPLASKLTGRKIYAISADGFEKGGLCAFEMDVFVDKYVHTIHQQFKGQPILLGGWSSGGVVAKHVARRLEQQGVRTSVFLLDSTSSRYLQETMSLEQHGSYVEKLARLTLGRANDNAQWEAIEKQVRANISECKTKRDQLEVGFYDIFALLNTDDSNEEFVRARTEAKKMICIASSVAAAVLGAPVVELDERDVVYFAKKDKESELPGIEKNLGWDVSKCAVQPIVLEGNHLEIIKVNTPSFNMLVDDLNGKLVFMQDRLLSEESMSLDSQRQILIKDRDTLSEETWKNIFDAYIAKVSPCEAILFSTPEKPLYLKPQDLEFDLKTPLPAITLNTYSLSSVEIDNLFLPLSLGSYGQTPAPKHIQIIGDAGSGKTTLGKTIVNKVNQKNLWPELFPKGAIWLPIRHLKLENNPIPQTLAHEDWVKFFNQFYRPEFEALEWGESQRTTFCRRIVSSLKEGKSLLVIDGLDEKPFNSDDALKPLFDKTLFPYIACTTRRYGMIESLKFDRPFELAGITHKQAAKLVDTLSESAQIPREKKEKIFLFMEEKIPAEIRQSPLILTLLLYTLRKSQNLELLENLTQTALYETLINEMLERYLSHPEANSYLTKGGVDPKDPDCELLIQTFTSRIKEILSDTASEIFSNNSTTIDGRTLSSKLIQAYPTGIPKWAGANNVAFNPIKHLRYSGLIKNSTDTTQVEFPHLTFTEFFAAKKLVRNLSANPEQAILFIRSHAKDSKFIKIFSFASGMLAKERLDDLTIFFQSLFGTAPQERKIKLEIIHMDDDYIDDYMVKKLQVLWPFDYHNEGTQLLLLIDCLEQSGTENPWCEENNILEHIGKSLFCGTYRIANENRAGASMSAIRKLIESPRIAQKIKNESYTGLHAIACSSIQLRIAHSREEGDLLKILQVFRFFLEAKENFFKKTEERIAWIKTAMFALEIHGRNPKETRLQAVLIKTTSHIIRELATQTIGSEEPAKIVQKECIKEILNYFIALHKTIEGSCIYEGIFFSLITESSSLELLDNVQIKQALEVASKTLPSALDISYTHIDPFFSFTKHVVQEEKINASELISFLIPLSKSKSWLVRKKITELLSTFESDPNHDKYLLTIIKNLSSDEHASVVCASFELLFLKKIDFCKRNWDAVSTYLSTLKKPLEHRLAPDLVRVLICFIKEQHDKAEKNEINFIMGQISDFANLTTLKILFENLTDLLAALEAPEEKQAWVSTIFEKLSADNTITLKIDLPTRPENVTGFFPSQPNPQPKITCYRNSDQALIASYEIPTELSFVCDIISRPHNTTNEP